MRTSSSGPSAGGGDQIASPWTAHHHVTHDPHVTILELRIGGHVGRAHRHNRRAGIARRPVASCSVRSSMRMYSIGVSPKYSSVCISGAPWAKLIAAASTAATGHAIGILREPCMCQKGRCKQDFAQPHGNGTAIVP
jgi:hypothetical protein